MPITSMEARRVYQEAECLYTMAEVEAAIAQMAAAISDALRGSNPVVLCLMKGAVVLTGKLLPLLDFPLQLEYVGLTRYHGDVRGGKPIWHQPPTHALASRHVLIVDDILDKGETLMTVIRSCQVRGAQSIRTAVLVDKQLPTDKALRRADFTALTAPNRYLFGCGMDYREYWRNAPGIYAVRGE